MRRQHDDFQMQRCVAVTMTGRRCSHKVDLDSAGRCKFHRTDSVQCRGVAITTGLRCQIRWDIGLDGMCEYHTPQDTERVASPWGDRVEDDGLPGGSGTTELTWEEHHLVDAVSRRSEAEVRELVRDGVYCHDALARAIQSGSVITVELLLDAAKAVDADWDPTNLNGRGWSILHAAVSWGKADLAGWLITSGLVSVHAVDEMKRTPLHVAENVACAKLLLDEGGKVNCPDEIGQTPVHTCCSSYYVEKELLKLLIDQAQSEGMDINTSDKEGNRPLHLLLSNLHRGPGSVSANLVSLLLDAGANATDPSKDGRSPLSQLLQPLDHPFLSEDDVVRRLLSDVQVGRRLVSSGAYWDDSSEKYLETSKRVRTALQAVRVGIKRWVEDTDNKVELTNIPNEVFQGGARSVEVLLKDLDNSLELFARSKICVVGPSGWGKTSFVKSISLLEPVRDSDSGSTVGIDRLPFTFDVPPKTEKDKLVRHEVTFWDFAGQDVYQVAHALFFSDSTVYLLCVNLFEYAKHLRAQPAKLERFVYENVLRWVGLITFRQRDAKFVIVGTHEDLVVDKSDIKGVKVSFQLHLDAWADKLAQNGEAIQVEDSVYKDWIIMSSKNRDSVLDARAELKRIVVDSGKAVEMGTTHHELIDSIERIRSADATSASKIPVTRRLIRPSIGFIFELCHGSSLSVDDCRSILRTLGNLGDILWYQDKKVGALEDYIILDADVVLQLVKDVISHEYQRNEPQDEHEKALQDHGILSHELLMRGKHWPLLDRFDDEPEAEAEDGDVQDDEESNKLTQAFKSLLEYFQLAYPTQGSKMRWNSDLIVPAYWQASEYRGPSPEFEQVKHELGHEPATIIWTYSGLPVHISSTVFRHFAVGINCSMVDRKNSATAIECSLSREFAAHITLNHIRGSSNDTIQIHVTAGGQDAAWSAIQYYVVVMESVLKRNPGLHSHVRREFLDDSNRTHDVLSPEEEAKRGFHPSLDLKTQHGTPPDFKWYTLELWTYPHKMEEIRMQSCMRRILANVEALEKEEENLPSLWKAELNPESKILKLEILSDVSQLCFHDPIHIDLSHDWVEYEALMKTGLWIFSNVILDVVSKLDVLSALVKKGIDASDSVLADRIQRQRTAQQLAGEMAERDGQLSPQQSRDLLLKLLVHHHPTGAFDVSRIPEVSGLKRAWTKDGRCVWANQAEIEWLGLEQRDAKAEGDEMRKKTGAPPRLELQLTFETLTGSKKRRATYISWKLVHQTRPLPTSETEKHSSNTDSMSWSGTPYPVERVVDIAMLRECSLHVEVKRERKLYFQRITMVGEGSVALGDISDEPIDSGQRDIELKSKAGKPTGVILTFRLRSP